MIYRSLLYQAKCEVTKRFNCVEKKVTGFCGVHLLNKKNYKSAWFLLDKLNTFLKILPSQFYTHRQVYPGFGLVQSQKHTCTCNASFVRANATKSSELLDELKLKLSISVNFYISFIITSSSSSLKKSQRQQRSLDLFWKKQIFLL